MGMFGKILKAVGDTLSPINAVKTTVKLSNPVRVVKTIAQPKKMIAQDILETPVLKTIVEAKQASAVEQVAAVVDPAKMDVEQLKKAGLSEVEAAAYVKAVEITDVNDLPPLGPGIFNPPKMDNPALLDNPVDKAKAWLTGMWNWAKPFIFKWWWVILLVLIIWRLIFRRRR